MELSWEIFNLLNQHVVTAVDQEYTFDRVLPIVNGKTSELSTLKTTSGTAPRLNPNFGQPTRYQQPMSMRFGARIKF